MAKKILCVIAFMLALVCVLASCVGNKQPEHTHAYGEWETTKSSTCTTEGSKERYCSCGEKQTATISMTEHVYGEWKTVENATITNSGIRERACACGKKETESIAQLTSANVSASELAALCNTIKSNYSTQSRITIEADWYYSKEKTVYVNDGNFKAIYMYENTSDVVEKWYCKSGNNYYIITKIAAGGNYYHENDAYYETITEDAFNHALDNIKSSNTGLEWAERALNEFDSTKLNITATRVENTISYVIDCSEAGVPVTITLEVTEGQITKAILEQTGEDASSVIEYKYEGSITIPDLGDFRNKNSQ